MGTFLGFVVGCAAMRKFKGVRWAVIGMAFLGTAINYIDRANLGVAEAIIREELGLSKGQMGLILSAFFFTYAFGQLPAGWIVDRLGARLTYTGACLWWSLFTAATALGNGFKSLFAFRLLLGIGEAGAYPANAKAASEWFPKKERALASSIFDSGSRIGTALSLPLISLVVHYLGWRWSFVISGLLGIAWATGWYLFYRTPDTHPWITPEELSYIKEGGARIETKEGEKARWRDLFRYRTIWGMALGFFCLSFVIYFYITWFPTYLREARGFSALQVGTLGMIPPLVAAVGGWCGGLLSDRLFRRGLSLTAARKIPICLGMAGSSVIWLAALAPDTSTAVALLALSYASLAFAAAGVWTLPSDVAPSAGSVGSVGGIQNCASNIAGIVLGPLMGYILDFTGNDYVLCLGIAAGVGLFGALVYLFVVGRIEPLPLRK
jgi:MFS transporter, ACS family, D-galactonate transporter